MFNNLKTAIQDRSMTLKAFADFLGISEKTLQNKLNGVTEFSLGEAEKIELLFQKYKREYLFDRKS